MEYFDCHLTGNCKIVTLSEGYINCKVYRDAGWPVMLRNSQAGPGIKFTQPRTHLLVNPCISIRPCLEWKSDYITLNSSGQNGRPKSYTYVLLATTSSRNLGPIFLPFHVPIYTAKDTMRWNENLGGWGDRHARKREERERGRELSQSERVF